jgi:hypothetical protein
MGYRIWSSVSSTTINTRAKLEQLRAELEAMRRHEPKTFYKATHNACRYVMRLPAPWVIQELVQAWRALPTRS